MTRIRPYKKKDLDFVLELYELSFRRVAHKHSLLEKLENLQSDIDSNTAVIAEEENRQVAFGLYGTIENYEEKGELAEFYTSHLMTARALLKETKKMSEDERKIFYEEEGIIAHPSLFTQRKRKVRSHDFTIPAYAVHPLFQNKGIGKKVVQRILKYARKESNNAALYVSAIAQTASPAVFSACGFSSILTMDNHYYSGDGTVIMGTLL